MGPNSFIRTTLGSLAKESCGYSVKNVLGVIIVTYSFLKHHRIR